MAPGGGGSGQSERLTHVRRHNGINAASFTRQIFDVHGGVKRRLATEPRRLGVFTITPEQDGGGREG